MSENKKKQKPTEKASADKTENKKDNKPKDKTEAAAENKKAKNAAYKKAEKNSDKADERKNAESGEKDAVTAEDELTEGAVGEELGMLTDSGEEMSSEEEGSEEEGVTDLLREKWAPLFAFKDSMTAAICRMGLPDMFLVRFITVFFFFSGLNVFLAKKKEMSAVSGWRDYIPQVNMTTTVIMMVSSFIILSVIYYVINRKKTVFDQILAIAAILYFDITLVWRAADFNLGFSLMMVTCVLVYYIFGTMKSTKAINSIPWWLCGIVVFIMAGFVTWFLSITTIARHQNFGSAAHDFGLFVQMYHSLANNGTAVTTVERDTLMSHFLIHASYIFYALVPFFKLAPRPETLLIAQAVLSMGGVIPLFLIARRHKMNGLPLIFMCLAYTFCIGLTASCYYEFHENAFLPTILMWLLWAVDGKKYIAFYIFSVLTCIVKEDAPLYVASIGMFMFFEHKGNKGRINGLIMTVIAMSYMFFITAWLTENGDGQMMMSSRFSILMIDETKGLREVIKNVIIDPAYLFSLFVKDDTRIFFFQVMLPFLFIPFFTRKLHRFLLMIPFIVMNLVIGAGYGYAANVGFQYVFGPCTILVYLCLINVEDMNHRNKQSVPVLLGCASMIMTMATSSHNYNNYTYHRDNHEYFDKLETMLDNIPKDASVGCDTFIAPHVADHEELYLFDSGDIDENWAIRTPERFNFIVLPVLNDNYEEWSAAVLYNGYTLYDSVDGRYEVYKSPAYNR